MTENSWLWLILTIICILIQGYYSMLEMASVSFNKVRLQYYVSNGNKRAIWLNALLKNPSKLFGTTLLGVNIGLQIGSECSRRFYESISVNPDMAPLTQVFLVLIFAELTPMFAGRKYAEHVVMLGMPLLYLSAKIMTPFNWFLSLITKSVHFLITGKSSRQNIFLSRDEIQRAIEEKHQKPHDLNEEDMNVLVSNIFSMEQKLSKHLMIPLHAVQMIPVHYSVGQMHSILNKTYHAHLPVYQNFRNKIIGIASCRYLIEVDATKQLTSYIHPPWFVMQNSTITQILKQFRCNNQKIAVVLDYNGQAIGILTLEDIITELFGSPVELPSMTCALQDSLIERTFPGDMKIKDFNKEFNVSLKEDGTETLGQLVVKISNHNPDKDEIIHIDQFEIRIKESSLTGPKLLSIRTIV